MNKLSKIMTSSRGAISARGLSILLLICICGPNRLVIAAQMSEARVTQVVQDVKLLPSNSAPRPATVNDNVREGTAVRTGQDSRTELTFPDLTLTRLGANSVFSFNAETRTLELGQGSVLMQVPPKGAAVKVKTAAVTAAITGGTAMFGVGPPIKFMVLEGTGTYYPPGHPEEAITLHGGEMVTVTPDGHFVQATFDVKKVVQTSELIINFPELENMPLILEVIQQQDQLADQSQPGSNPPPNNTDKVDQASAAGVGGPTGPPSEFGPPTTITAPDPYVISNGTTIQTDPTITTNGVTDFGTLYRGTAVDGTPTQFLFGEAPTTFDQMVFSGPQNNLPVAVFKFAHLQLTGDPTVTVPSGGATNLAFASVGDITSGGAGGTLTFGGQVRVDFVTQNGSINLGSEISFNVPHLTFYARGNSSNLTLGSAVTASEALKLYAGGTIQVNGNVDTNNFVALAGGDFLAGSGVITANNIDIESTGGNININGSQFPNPPTFGGSANLIAANTLNLTLDVRPNFGWDTLNAQATTINIDGATTFDFSNSSSVVFTAGTGGINASNIHFVGSPPGGLNLTSGGSINIGSTNSEDATISAATSFTASGDVTGAAIGSTLTAGTTVDVGGNLFVITLTAGGNINVGNGFIALNVNAPSSILTVQGNIGPFGGPASLQYTYNVDSIISPAGINFSFNGTPNFVGKLTINANTLTFDPATGIAFANFNGVNADTFGSGNPAEGGDGGTFIVNTTGNITTVSGSDITATTGLNTDGGVYSGAGGSVTLHSSGGLVTVNDRIEVSSDDGQAQRQSASGGTILLQSDLMTGSGITVGSNAQLLSLLNANAPGPGGSITLSTMGADITVNGTIEADRGTITMDQTDPVMAMPRITIDGATLISDTLNVHSIGDLRIADTTPTTLTFSTATLHADRYVSWNVAQSTLPASINSLHVTAGNGLTLFGGTSDVAATLTLNMQNASTLTAGLGGINAQFTDILYSGGELNLMSGGNITAHSITFTDGYARGSVNAVGSITTIGDLLEGNITAGTSIGVGGNMFASVIGAGTTISAGGDIGASTMTAGGNISASITRVQTITSPTGLLTVTDMIRPDVFSTDPMFPAQGAKAPHVYTVDSIVTPNGIDFSGNQFGGINGYTSGGILTINATTLTFDPAVGIGIVNFNGADAGALDFGGSPFTTVGGDGGVFIANATGDITTTSGSPISATTGQIDPNLSSATSSGAGGTVELNSTAGMVTVNNRIEVSTAEPTSTVAPFRQSASAGNITIKSGKANSQAINIGSTAQLLSLLAGATPGSGGTIEISATGNSSTIDVDNANGKIQADGGTIAIQNKGAGGFINVANANMSADIIKIQVLGADGTLSIGGGSINANTLLNLYAAGSNGSIIFTGNVTLNSTGSAAVIAANTVTINNLVTVTIAGPDPAKVFANLANYAVSSGGNGTTTGVFAGSGAAAPQPFPPPGGPAAATTVSSSSSTSTSVAPKSTQVTVASSGPLTLSSASQSKTQSISASTSTSKTALSAKRLTATANLVPSHPVTAPLAAGKTTMTLANSADLLSLLETGSQAGDKINVAKPQTPNRAPQSGGVNSANSTARRGNVVQRGSHTPASVTTISPSAETTGNVPFQPANTSATANVARPANN